MAVNINNKIKMTERIHFKEKKENSILYKINFSFLSVRHLPVVRQRTQLFLIYIGDFVGGFGGRFWGLLSFSRRLSGSRGLAGPFNGNLPRGICALVLVLTGLCWPHTSTRTVILPCTPIHIHVDLSTHYIRHAWWVRVEPLQHCEPPGDREQGEGGEMEYEDNQHEQKNNIRKSENEKQGKTESMEVRGWVTNTSRGFQQKQSWCVIYARGRGTCD